MKWSVTYRKCYNDDGTLYFPEKLTEAFLLNVKRAMGSYIFSNQYLNEIIPADKQSFKKEWFRYFTELPQNVNTFIYVDPALSEADTADFTGIVVVSVDPDGNWYVRFARRYRISPTELMTLLFRLNKEFKPQAIGIEEVAFQKALLYFLGEEMRRRDLLLPVTGVKPPTDKTKEMRILSLVPRFEWGHIFMAQGLQDLELELLQFPRGAHDDLIDSLASIEMIATTPARKPQWNKAPHPNSPDYERYIIQQMQFKKENDDE